MAAHFQYVIGLASPNADELKAQFWLPEAMQFPAIDPDAKPVLVVEQAEGLEDLAEEEQYAQAA